MAIRKYIIFAVAVMALSMLCTGCKAENSGNDNSVDKSSVVETVTTTVITTETTEIPDTSETTKEEITEKEYRIDEPPEEPYKDTGEPIAAPANEPELSQTEETTMVSDETAKVE